MKTAKKLLCFVLSLAMLSSILVMLPVTVAEAAFESEPSKGMFYPGNYDNLTMNAYGNTQYGLSNSAQYGKYVFDNVAGYFGNASMLAATKDNKFDNEQYFYGYSASSGDVGERYLKYKVVGGSYFAFNYFTSHIYHTDLANLLYDRNSDGWQLWASSDNGVTYRKISPYDYYAESIVRWDGTTATVVKDSQCWFGQDPHYGVVDFLAKQMHDSNVIGVNDPTSGAGYFIFGKAYYLDPSINAVKIVFPDYSYVNDGAACWQLALTGVKSSWSMIDDTSAGSTATKDGATVDSYSASSTLNKYVKSTGVYTTSTSGTTVSSAKVSYKFDSDNAYINVVTDADYVEFCYINNVDLVQKINSSPVFNMFNNSDNFDGDNSSPIGCVTYVKSTGKFITGLPSLGPTVTTGRGGCFTANGGSRVVKTSNGISYAVPRSSASDKFLYYVAAYNEGDTIIHSTGGRIASANLGAFKVRDFGSQSSAYTFSNGRIGNLKHKTYANTFHFRNDLPVPLYNANKGTLAGSGKVGTGCYASTSSGTFYAVLENDTNGDAVFDVLDVVAVKNDLLGKDALSEYEKEAIGVSSSSDASILDVLNLKNDLISGVTFTNESAYVPVYRSYDKEYSITSGTNGKATLQSIKNYLSSALTVEGVTSATSTGTLLPGVDPTFEQDFNTIKKTGAKLIARAAFIWGNGLEMNTHFANCKKYARKIHEYDERILLEACVFETAFQETLSRTIIPQYVCQAFNQSYTGRTFRYQSIYNSSYLNKWGTGGSVPDITKTEAKMWYYYLATQYIDAGFDIINLAQINLVAENDKSTGANLGGLIAKIRDYAALYGRNKNVLVTAHVTADYHTNLKNYNSKMNFDFDSFPARLYDGDGAWSDKTKCELKTGYLDAVYGKTSASGNHPQGFTVSKNLYIVEIDNFSNSSHIGSAGAVDIYPWGYDEIRWFSTLTKAKQYDFLKYMANFIQTTAGDSGRGYVALPGRRVSERTVNGATEYFYSASSDVKNGFGQENNYIDYYLNYAG